MVNALDIMVKGVFEEHGFVESFVKNIDDWDDWRNSFEPHKEPLPGEWGEAGAPSGAFSGSRAKISAFSTTSGAFMLPKTTFCDGSPATPSAST